MLCRAGTAQILYGSHRRSSFLISNACERARWAKERAGVGAAVGDWQGGLTAADRAGHRKSRWNPPASAPGGRRSEQRLGTVKAGSEKAVIDSFGCRTSRICLLCLKALKKIAQRFLRLCPMPIIMLQRDRRNGYGLDHHLL